MERLSKTLADVLNECIHELSQVEEDIVQAALHRLAAYEDTGLMPEDVLRISNLLRLVGEGCDNHADIEKAKRVLPIVLNEVCTVMQKEYIMAYFVEGLNIPQIAKLYGVNSSTVSRTINRGLDKAYSYLRFVSPLFVNAPRRKGYLRKGW